MRQVVAYKRLKTIENHSTFKAQNAGVCPVLAPVEGLFSNRNNGQICLNIYFCFILLFTSSPPCRKDHSTVLYFLQVIIVQIQVYNWEIRQHSNGLSLCTCWCLIFRQKSTLEHPDSLNGQGLSTSLGASVTHGEKYTQRINKPFQNYWQTYNFSPHQHQHYPASRGYIFAVWAGVGKEASADNRLIFYRACAKFVTRFASKINRQVCRQMARV